jgi:hypothetical protein
MSRWGEPGDERGWPFVGECGQFGPAPKLYGSENVPDAVQVRIQMWEDSRIDLTWHARTPDWLRPSSTTSPINGDLTPPSRGKCWYRPILMHPPRGWCRLTSADERSSPADRIGSIAVEESGSSASEQSSARSSSSGSAAPSTNIH